METGSATRVCIHRGAGLIRPCGAAQGFSALGRKLAECLSVANSTVQIFKHHNMKFCWTFGIVAVIKSLIKNVEVKVDIYMDFPFDNVLAGFSC
jgi:hypothetical protein